MSQSRSRSGSLRERLIGAWTLVEYTVTDDAGIVSHPMSEQAAGFIIYTPDGYMSAQLMTPGRPAYASGDMHHGDVDEESAAARGYIAYSGPFYVDEAAGRLQHTMQVCLFPNWLGNIQERYIDLQGDRLTLSSDPIPFDGRPQTPRLVWQRAPEN